MGNDENITISWGAAGGTTELCLTVANLCFDNPTPSCMTIEVLPEPTAEISGSGELCAGGSVTIDLEVNFTGQAPWEFVYTVGGVPQPPITTSDNPYIITVTDPEIMDYKVSPLLGAIAPVLFPVMRKSHNSFLTPQQPQKRPPVLKTMATST